MLVTLCRDMVLVNSQLSAEGMKQEVLDGQRTLDTFRQDVQKYLEQQRQIQALPAAQDCGIVHVNLQVCLLHSCTSKNNCVRPAAFPHVLVTVAVI